MILDTPEKDLIVTDTGMSEEEMVDMLAEKVQAYLDVNINLLLSYLYRLDVKEAEIKNALNNGSKEPGNYALARVIWKRQKQRIETKKHFNTKEIIDEDLAW